jgi:hypothetical protein
MLDEVGRAYDHHIHALAAQGFNLNTFRGMNAESRQRFAALRATQIAGRSDNDE